MSDLTITEAGVSVAANSAGSSISTGKRKVIRVTPTLDTSAYAQGDVLFNSVAIPNAVREEGGCSKLVAMFLLSKSTDELDANFIFSENSATFGTVNATANISDADLDTANVLGHLHHDASIAVMSELDNAKFYRIVELSSATNDNAIHANPMMLLQAAAGSTDVYVAAIQHDNSTNTYAADDWELIFHIQY